MALLGITTRQCDFLAEASAESPVLNQLAEAMLLQVIVQEGEFFRVQVGSQVGFVVAGAVVPHIAAGITIRRPNFRDGPSLQSNVIEVLQPGMRLQLVGREGDFWQVVLTDGRLGFVHSDLVQVEGGGRPAVLTGATVGRPNFRDGPSLQSNVIEVLQTGVVLQLLGREGDFWQVALADGRRGFVHSDLVQVGGEAGRGPVTGRGAAVVPTTISIASPFTAAAQVTTSSRQGHHTPYGGSHSCDMDVAGASRGTPVLFRASCSPEVPLRGVVDTIRPSCASGVIADGGNRVRLALQRFDGANWVPLNRFISYAHLDPVSVRQNDVVEVGGEIGRLGPAQPAGFPANIVLICGLAHPPGSPLLDEYHSGCAEHSHVHIEGHGSTSVSSAGVTLAAGAEVLSFRL